MQQQILNNAGIDSNPTANPTFGGMQAIMGNTPQASTAPVPFGSEQTMQNLSLQLL